MVASSEYTVAILGGAAAGLSVDMMMFPIDTLKTRMQSAKGFYHAGGFKNIYSGVGSTLVGSMPGAALFFSTYEGMKGLLLPYASRESHDALVHMTAASCGEVTACLVRVPTEVVKQRAQATQARSLAILREVIHTENLSGLYRGYFSTVLREIPFSLLQFPLWESLKLHWQRKQGGKHLDAWQSGICGALAGGVSAALTTPMDVVKTRIMLAERNHSLTTGNIAHAVSVVYREKGVRGLFAGVVPRVMWISIGGCVFLGVYDKVKMTLLGSW